MFVTRSTEVYSGIRYIISSAFADDQVISAQDGNAIIRKLHQELMKRELKILFKKAQVCMCVINKEIDLFLKGKE